jgi:hypothetical protein
MRALSSEDSRLGFHSEAECHKYFPAMFDWRIAELTKTVKRLKDIRATIASGGMYRLSSFERKVPLCHMNGAAISGGGLTWRVSGDKNGSLTVSGECLTYHPEDAVEISFFDAAGTVFPDNYTITRAGLKPLPFVRTRDDTRAVCRAKENKDGSWSFSLEQDSWKWGRDRRIRPAWIYVRRPAEKYVWPAEENGPPIHRLNLYKIAGDHFGRIVWEDEADLFLNRKEIKK